MTPSPHPIHPASTPLPLGASFPRVSDKGVGAADEEECSDVFLHGREIRRRALKREHHCAALGLAVGLTLRACVGDMMIIQQWD